MNKSKEVEDLKQRVEIMEKIMVQQFDAISKLTKLVCYLDDAQKKQAERDALAYELM